MPRRAADFDAAAAKVARFSANSADYFPLIFFLLSHLPLRRYFDSLRRRVSRFRHHVAAAMLFAAAASAAEPLPRDAPPRHFISMRCYGEPPFRRRHVIAAMRRFRAAAPPLPALPAMPPRMMPSRRRCRRYAAPQSDSARWRL